MKTMISTGKDKFGAFAIERNHEQEQELCISCDEPMPIKLEYLDLMGFPEGIDVKATILKDEHAAIGITCGCYAKLHRQVAHIEDAQKRQKLPK